MRRIFTLIAAAIVMMSMSGNALAQYATNDGNVEIKHVMTPEEEMLLGTRGTNWTETDPPEGEIFSVAEFQPQEGVLVRSPFGIPYELVKQLSLYTKVITIVTGPGEENAVTEDYEDNGVNMDNCEFLHAPTDSYWTRDYGPWFIGYGDNKIGIVDIKYNRPRPNDDEIPVELADYLSVELFGCNLVSPGGNYMSDGLYAAAATDLIYEENGSTQYQNPPLSEEEVDQNMIDYLGVTNHLVTMDPLGDYIKHIDCWGKFLDVDKVLIGQVPESDSRYEDFEEVANYFANTNSSWGNKYNVYRVYTPGDSPATPYTNSLILNNKVFVPQTGSQWDDEAIASYQEAMPGYEIIGMEEHPYNGWQNTDALHCRTHEIADRGMLLIRHTPIQGVSVFQEEIEINAKVTAYSGETIYADSVKVYYKLDEEDYQYVVMSNTSENNYTTTLDIPEGTTKLSYYLHAADESGRSENHPYIGAPDPHVLILGAAQIDLSAEEVNTTAMVDLTDEGTFTISNTGDADLNYTITKEGTVNWLTLSSEDGTVAPGATETITVTTDATDLDVQMYNASLNIASNDPNNGQKTVTVNFDVTINTGVDYTSAKINTIAPNPFNNETNIQFTLNEKVNVELVIYNMNGQRVKTIVSETLQAGDFNYKWNGSNDKGAALTNGVYFYTFVAGNKTSTGKIVLSK